MKLKRRSILHKSELSDDRFEAKAIDKEIKDELNRNVPAILLDIGDYQNALPEGIHARLMSHSLKFSSATSPLSCPTVSTKEFTNFICDLEPILGGAPTGPFTAPKYFLSTLTDIINRKL